MRLIDPAVRDEAIGLVRETIGDEKVTDMFVACFDNTLQTTVETLEDGSTFIITGDIPAMWLRDSVAQVRPYLLFADRCETLSAAICGLIAKHAQCVLHDPYANAFNRHADGAGHQDDHTDMSAAVWERKYEIDSLSYPIELAYLYWRATGRVEWATDRFAQAASLIVRTIAIEQNHEVLSNYRFARPDPLLPTDTLMRDGLGSLTVLTGMTWSAFRPSDDACTHGYNVPGNAFAALALRHLAIIADELLNAPDLSRRATFLADQIVAGVRGYGIVDHPKHGQVLAYEVDGCGNVLFMDDANVPSLLSLPMLGVCTPTDPIYQATRSLVLSEDNPYYYRGEYAAGVGSPHTPQGNIWPIALCVQGITSTDSAERRHLLATLRDTDAGTGMMHESFAAGDPASYTREWFSWANSMFCEFVLDVAGMPVSTLLSERSGAQR